MKQLIPQSRIDEAAEKSSSKTVRDLPTRDMRYEMSAMEWSGWFEDEFKSGVQFALKEIEPLIYEFQYWLEKFEKYNKNHGKTTQQLLEEFINSKNKESE